MATTATFIAMMILMLISLILLGAYSPTPARWVVVVLSVIALLLLVFGGINLSIGR
jgi:hypothetical protein